MFIYFRYALITMIGISLFMVSVLAKADNLIINNQTTDDLSFVVEGICSAEFGTIQAGNKKIISEADFHQACEYHPDSCQVNVVPSANCNKGSIATLELDSSIGVKRLIDTSGIYLISWNGFYLEISIPSLGLKKML